MHGASPDPALVGLYQRAVLCRTFPGAYTLETAKRAPVEALWAMELMDAAAKMQSS